MATKVWEVLHGMTTLSAYGDSAEDVAKALLKDVRKRAGEYGFSSIRLDVVFNGEEGNYIGGVTVSE